MENAPIYCRYNFDDAQFRVARRWATKSKGFYLKLASFAVLMVVLCSFTAYRRIHEIWSGNQLHWGPLFDTFFPLLMCLVIFSLFLFLINPYQQTRTFRKGIAYRRDYNYTIDDSGLALHTSDIDASVKWPLFDSVSESRDGFVVRMGKTNAFDWLPKSGFESSAEYDRCREIFRTHAKLRQV